MTQGTNYTKAQAKKDILLLLKRLDFYVNNMNIKEVKKAIDAIVDKISPFLA